MNTANPFQIPECFQKSNLELRRRERFKRGVIAIVFAVMALLIVLLIQGCMTERAQTGGSNEVFFIPNAAAPAKSPVSAAQPASVSSSSIVVQPVSRAGQRPAAVVQQEPVVYVVKSGDSLSRIAKLHGSTVKAIKAANDLASDRICVGAKLKIPQA